MRSFLMSGALQMSTKRNTLWKKWSTRAMIAFGVIALLALAGNVLYVEYKSHIPKVESFNMRPCDMTTTNDRFDWSMVVTAQDKLPREKFFRHYNFIVSARTPTGFNKELYLLEHPDDAVILYGKKEWLAIITNQLRNPFLDRWRGLRP